MPVLEAQLHGDPVGLASGRLASPAQNCVHQVLSDSVCARPLGNALPGEEELSACLLELVRIELHKVMLMNLYKKAN